FIPWNDYGFKVIGEAKNGEEALEMADSLQPDIVLTDINMPKMDGLTFAQKLIDIAPNTGIIFITGHNEFEYAKKAIRIGASDYILKPFEKEELILTLLKLKDNIHKANEINTTIKGFDNSFIMSFLTGKIPLNSMDLHKSLKELGFNYEQSNYVVVCLDIDHLDYTYSNQEEKILWRFSVMNILKELIDDHESLETSDCHAFYDYEGNITCIYELQNNDNPDQNIISLSETPLLDVLQCLTKAINTYLDFTITIGIGTIQKGINGISTSYNEALIALHNKYLENTSQMIFYSDTSLESKNFSFYNASFNESLLKYLRLDNIEAIKDLLGELYSTMNNERISRDFSRIIQMGLLSLLLSYITQSGKQPELILGNDNLQLNTFESCDTLDLQQDFILSLYQTTVTYNMNNITSRSKQIAQKARDFIHENYSDSMLNVQDIAANQYINQTYLRSMFKKEFGMTICDYILKARMDAAATLVQGKTYRLADIAEMVGYNDSSYFSKCFKKFHGISPSQYELTR
nr:response regulator [Vallitaleaceae bacterium]